ncbi:MAG: hypothetical protein M3311_03650 [Thermoproteota archaeon]|nr:hypothetical protein [Thermoproteota archaeon]
MKNSGVKVWLGRQIQTIGGGSLYTTGGKKRIQKTLLQKLYMKEIRLGARSIYATAVVVVFGTGYA